MTDTNKSHLELKTHFNIMKILSTDEYLNDEDYYIIRDFLNTFLKSPNTSEEM